MTMNFSNYTPESLLDYLKNTGENRHWEFKSRGLLGKNFKQGIASEVSAFANSGGGRIVLGIKETSHEIDVPIDGKEKKQREYAYQIDRWPESHGNQKMVDYLSGIVSTCVVPHLQEFQVYRIAPQSADEDPIFVVDIGDSAHAPHQTNVNDQFRYFYRAGDKSKEAPHHFLEAKRDRQTRTVLAMRTVDCEVTGYSITDQGKFRIEVTFYLIVGNTTLTTATDWGVHVKGVVTDSRWKDNLSNRSLATGFSIHGINRSMLPQEDFPMQFSVYVDVDIDYPTLREEVEVLKAWDEIDMEIFPVSQNHIGSPFVFPPADEKEAKIALHSFQKQIKEKGISEPPFSV